MGRLGIIAASGNLPLQLAEAALSQGETPFIICLNGQIDHDYAAFPHASVPGTPAGPHKHAAADGGEGA